MTPTNLRVVLEAAGIALYYPLCAAFGWSACKAWFGFWAWRDRRFLKSLYRGVYGIR